jgi:hypothetical protein
MAAATSKLVVNAFPNGLTSSTSQFSVFGTLQLSAGGTYVNPNGIPVSWQFFNPDGSVFPAPYGPQTTDPIVAYFTSATGGVNGATAVYSYVYDSVHNSLRIYAGATELGSGAAIVVDTIVFEAHFAKGV